jgi:hypothetical protein
VRKVARLQKLPVCRWVRETKEKQRFGGQSLESASILVDGAAHLARGHLCEPLADLAEELGPLARAPRRLPSRLPLRGRTRVAVHVHALAGVRARGRAPAGLRIRVLVNFLT